MASRPLGKDWLVGAELGHYRLVEKIGAGGMGEVYRACDQHLARDVAIKVLPPGTLSDESARRHFHKEALILSQLNHPNIATIHDFDTQQGVDFLVMEYIPGITLSTKVAARPLPEKEILSLGVQLAEGLSAAHQRGIVHRDLKPGNLRLSSEGRLKILDFGLAKLRLPVTESVTTDSLIDTQSLAGTLPYMAPEQLRGEDTDARADIHNAGAVLYEMSTGRCPFSEVECSQLVAAILYRPPLRPSLLNRDVPPGLEQVIMKCMEKEQEHRYQSAKELAVDLRRLERDRMHLAGEHSAGSRPVPIGRREAMLAAACGLVIVVLVAAFWFAARKRSPDAAPVTPSIAVLPFADLSPGKDQEYFSDGLAEELLNSLAKMPGLHVVARTSSFQFKEKNEDLRVIGKKLNVAAVLEGSIRKQGQRVRISAQLVQVSDGFELWSEVYDRDLTDIFAVQEEIARSVAGSLRVTLLGEKALAPRPTNLEAYNAYLQGKYFQARPTKENLVKTITYYQQATSLDSSYAPAWAALSKAYSIHAAAYGPVQEFSRAREAAEQALALDPSLADAHAAIGEIKLDYDWDWTGADASYQRALVLEKGNAEVVERAALVAATLNRFEEALPLSRRAVELDPLRASAYHALAYNTWWAGQLREAETAAEKGLELDPQFPWLHTVLSRVYLAESRPQDALAEAERDTAPVFHLQDLALTYHALARKKESDQALAELISKYKETAAFQIAEVYAFRGEGDLAFTWLERAYLQHDGGLTFAKGDPLLANLERDQRYPDFLKKMRLLA
jgi:TolB-like protein/tRNA A-37 threonylcarbamoyl transferase component Bud32/Tfp pilus assembly protein PilF